MRAYILIKVGGLIQETDVLESIKSFGGVKGIDRCFGSWDLVVEVEKESHEDLSETVFKIRGTPGVRETNTLILYSESAED